MNSSGPRLVAWVLAVGLGLGWSAPARAQDYFTSDANSVSFEVDRSRSRSERILIASLLGGAVLVGGVGLLLHLDSERKSSEVSARPGRHTGLLYTEERDRTRRAAIRSRNFAFAGYSVGGGLLIAALVTYFVTNPGRDIITVGDEQAPPSATSSLLVEPMSGGALVAGEWVF
jgi:hypothetical protein